MQKKVAWILCMGLLSLVLSGIVLSRIEKKTDIIFGGIDGAIVQSDTYSHVDPNANAGKLACFLMSAPATAVTPG